LGSIPGPSTSNLSARAAEEKRTRFSIKGGFSLSQLEGGREGGREGVPCERKDLPGS
jgi:hypothetical protein